MTRGQARSQSWTTPPKAVVLEDNTNSELLIERLVPDSGAKGEWKAMTYLPHGTSVDYGCAILERTAADCDFTVRLVELVSRTKRTQEVLEVIES